MSNELKTEMKTDNADTILNLAAQVGKALQDKGLILATAESCTGGGVAQAITEIAGSTAWFDCGFIAYSNASKTELLDVSAALIAQMGSVSEEVAAAMASGALGSSNAHLAADHRHRRPDRRRAGQAGRHRLLRLGQRRHRPHRAPGVRRRPQGRARADRDPRAARPAALHRLATPRRSPPGPRWRCRRCHGCDGCLPATKQLLSMRSSAMARPFPADSGVI